MKKLSVILLAIAATFAIACSGAVKYDVTGTNAPEDGVVVYLNDQLSSAHIDSAVVANGSFHMKGKADKDAFMAVTLETGTWMYLFFNDGKPVTIDITAKTVTGSALNNKLTECDLRNSAAYDEYLAFIRAFTDLPEEEQEARMEEFIPQYQAKLDEYSQVVLDIIEENEDNLIPVAFIEPIPSLFGDEKMEELLEKDAPYAKHPYVVDMKRKMDESNARMDEAEAKKKAFIGQKFSDLEEADVDGNMHHLSEYVGKGNWVLVDFWAAWCGPCKAEMPNVVAAYKKYHDKGFDVVGLSFDRNKEDWVKAIKDWDMPWNHLSDLKYWQSVAAGVYGVNSIPDNLLIDPEGTIVARGLRGKALETKLAEIFD